MVISWKIPKNKWMIWGYLYFWKPPYSNQSESLEPRSSVVRAAAAAPGRGPGALATQGGRWGKEWHGLLMQKDQRSETLIWIYEIY
jgi:hypothetical protein